MSTNMLSEITRADLLPIAQQAVVHATNSRAPNTRLAYGKYWEQFAKWCARHRLEYLPAEPETVAIWLTDRAREVSISTLRVALSAIRHFHKAKGLANPAEHPTPAQVWEGIKREKTTRQVQKSAITPSDLRGMVRRCGTDVIGVRDRAMILLAFAAALRRSEVEALNVDDIEFVEHGLIVHVRQSKTDQTGAGEIVGVPYAAERDLCPVLALKDWMSLLCGDVGRDDPLFRVVGQQNEVSGHRLGGRSVANTVKRLAGDNGMDASEYSGHSLRAGLATAAVDKGVDILPLMRHCRWRSVNTPKRYYREKDAFRQNPAMAVMG